MGKTTAVSPFAPKSYPRLPAVPGVRFAAAEAGIRYKGRADLMLALFDPGTRAAGVLTQSKTRSAPVEWCATQLGHGRVRALVVNSGNSNAFTGRKGRETVRATAEHAAKAAGAKPEEVLIASTGVIGEPLDAGKFVGLLDGLARRAKPDGFAEAARAILTTDTFPKLATRKAKIGGVEVTINGFCKGAGMIAPDMATMLGFIFTDAAIARPVLKKLLLTGAERSFNCVTIDGDTSTSDTLLLFATGAAEKRGQTRIERASDPALAEFTAALHDLMRDLAIQIAMDGEGVTKLVTITVSGAASEKAARRIGLSIANSPLVKTAIAGEDANWGRIVAAVGKAGEEADRDRLSISYGDHVVARDGERAPDYDEATLARYMKRREIDIAVDVGVGRGRATVWTCDLTHGYIAINADYRT